MGMLPGMVPLLPVLLEAGMKPVGSFTVLVLLVGAIFVGNVLSLASTKVTIASTNTMIIFI